MGLGNEGRSFERTPHNVGREAVAVLAERLGLSLQPHSSSKCRLAMAQHQGRSLLLAQPREFMNLSGRSVSALLAAVQRRELGAQLGGGRLQLAQQLLVVADNCTAAFGHVYLGTGRSARQAHGGIHSIGDSLHDDSFLQLRVGVGHPPPGASVANYVLKPVTGAERSAWPQLLSNCADAILALAAADPLNLEAVKAQINPQGRFNLPGVPGGRPR